MAENFNSDEFKKQREEIEKIVEIQKELNSGNVGLFETLKDIHRYDKLIADQVKKRNRLKAVEEKIQKSRKSLIGTRQALILRRIYVKAQNAAIENSEI